MGRCEPSCAGAGDDYRRRPARSAVRTGLRLSGMIGPTNELVGYSRGVPDGTQYTGGSGTTHPTGLRLSGMIGPTNELVGYSRGVPDGTRYTGGSGTTYPTRRPVRGA